MEIIVIGSLNADLVARVVRSPKPGETLQGEDFNIYAGGKGANQAYAAAQLGGGVTMLGQVGKDDFGKSQINNLKAIGVDTQYIRVHPSRKTGIALIEVEESGENRIIVIPGANEIEPEFIRTHSELISKSKYILLQLETPMQTVKEALDLASLYSTKTILDPAPAQPIPIDWFPKFDYLTPNLTELAHLTNSKIDQNSPITHILSEARKLVDKGSKNVIVKMGRMGAMLVSEHQHNLWATKQVRAIDTTAAGDCFNGAFVCELSKGKTPDEAGRFAVKAATQSVTKKGAQPSMPDRQVLAAL